MADNATTPLIETRGLVKKFGSFTALNGVDLTVAHGGWKSGVHERYARWDVVDDVLPMAARMAGVDPPVPRQGPREVVREQVTRAGLGPHPTETRGSAGRGAGTSASPRPPSASGFRIRIPRFEVEDLPPPEGAEEASQSSSSAVSTPAESSPTPRPTRPTRSSQRVAALRTALRDLADMAASAQHA